jgi:DNA-binding GntR family transcriptional regulator
MVAEASVTRRCMRDRIRDEIVARILDETYPHGMRLKEMALAREFNVSQAPVREALRELEALGLVTSERFRGTQVRDIDIEELREAYELRATLEVRAVELAIAHGTVGIGRLETCLQELRRAGEADDIREFSRAALAFHRELVASSGNRTFLRTWDSLHFDVRAQLYMRRIPRSQSDLRVATQQHEALFARLQSGDAPGAVRIVREFFDDLVARLV